MDLERRDAVAVIENLPRNERGLDSPALSRNLTKQEARPLKEPRLSRRAEPLPVLQPFPAPVNFISGDIFTCKPLAAVLVVLAIEVVSPAFDERRALPGVAVIWRDALYGFAEF